MQLQTINYGQFEGTQREWRFEGLSLGDVNLLVGRNASGKTRALNVIHGLARLLSGGKLQYASGDYDVVFVDGDSTARYRLHYEGSVVKHEAFEINGRQLLVRSDGGAGKIYAEKEQRKLDFQTPDDEIAAVARRDSIQHPFFEPLHLWARSARHWAFGSSLGKDVLPVHEGTLAARCLGVAL